MARRTVTLVLCDVCQYQGSEVGAEWSEQVSVGGLVRLLDLCASHHGALIGDLAERLRRYGQEVKAPRSTRADRRVTTRGRKSPPRPPVG